MEALRDHRLVLSVACALMAPGVLIPLPATAESGSAPVAAVSREAAPPPTPNLGWQGSSVPPAHRPPANAAASATAPAEAARDASPAHWSYEGKLGPASWGSLGANYETCAAGTFQSPVDITLVTVTQLPPIEVHYQANPLSVKNNGHTAQLDYPAGSYILINGVRYNLVQIHFHSPSEHTVGGKFYDLTAHLVHKTDDGKLAVIDIPMEQGQDNGFMSTVLDNLPKEAGRFNDVAGVQINAAELLPSSLSYYSYTGSLTTPPCSEGVEWMVLMRPVQVSEAQMKAFTTIFPKSTRPVQPANGRSIKLGL